MRSIAVWTACLLATGALAQDADPERGAELFAQNCAVCHGSDATGSGPMADVLSIAPPDLTALASSGEFDTAEVVRRIDGRDLIISHGGPMPLFGHILRDRSGVVDDALGTPVFTSQAVLDIAAWLKTIQR